METSLVASEPAPQAAAPNGTRCWHVITCEYPPQSGGVSDYTYSVAKGLASSHDQVHVWTPTSPETAPAVPGVVVHNAGRFKVGDLRKLGRELDQFPSPRRLLVQWVPHGYGYKSMNVAFCLWLWSRAARQGDAVELMVHEPFLPFQDRKPGQNAAAVVQRLMMAILLGTARRIMLSTPAWEPMLRRFSRGHRNFEWLPVPSSIPVVADAEAIADIRRQYASDGLLVGHFGTFGQPITDMLDAIIPRIAQRQQRVSFLLMGGGSTAYRDRLLVLHPELAGVVLAAGHIRESSRLSMHLSACDVLIQPYPEGVTTRRTTIMSALSHGRAAVTTTGSHSEPFWPSSEAVALTPAGDTGAFVDATLRLLESEERRSSLMRAAKQLYDQQFDVRHTVDLLRAGH
jgi:glycosyltransferase involved in cell wall biosynthesis